MIKVLGKTFALLELIATRAERPTLPSEAATALCLNQATTVRILKDLLGLGYLTQISRNKGYVLGPMAQSVFARNHYQTNLIQAAAPLVSQCARVVGASVVLAVLQGTRRYVLLHENCNPRMNIDVSALYYEDIFVTATGRVLLAHAPPEVLSAILRQTGLPGKRQWMEAGTGSALRGELAKIKRTGYTAFRSGQTDLFIMACPVFINKTCAAALGCSFPGSDYSRQNHMQTLKAVRETAAAISAKLVTSAPAG